MAKGKEITTHVPADIEAASLLIWLLEEPGAKRWQMPEGTAVKLRTLRRFQAMEKDGATVPGEEITAAGCITLEQLRRLWQQVKAEQPAAAAEELREDHQHGNATGGSCGRLRRSILQRCRRQRQTVRRSEQPATDPAAAGDPAGNPGAP